MTITGRRGQRVMSAFTTFNPDSPPRERSTMASRGSGLSRRAFAAAESWTETGAKPFFSKKTSNNPHNDFSSSTIRTGGFTWELSHYSQGGVAGFGLWKAKKKK